MAPAIRWRSEHIATAAANYMNTSAVLANRRSIIMLATLKRAFSDELLKHPTQQVPGIKYAGPKVPVNEEKFLGTMGHMVENAKDYTGRKSSVVRENRN